MLTFRQLVDAFVAENEFDNATLGRLEFWCAQLGKRNVDTITTADIVEGIKALKERGKLVAGKNLDTKKTGKPLQGSTINRYVSQVGSVFIYGRDTARHFPHTYVIPTYGLKRAKEKADHNRYLRDDEYERVLACARVVDKTWRKMPALIVVAFHTGLRVGNLIALRGRDLNLKEGTLQVLVSKNDDPITSVLSTAAIAELKRLPKVAPDELVFGSRTGKPYSYRKLWLRIVARAKLGKGRVFHELRHSHGYTLARKGISQQMIMASMAHRSLAAAGRYCHANVSDKRNVIASVFG